MTDDHIELCPFCKSEAEIQYPGDMFVTCKGCKAMGPMANSDKSAIAVWNRRASPAPAIPAGLSDQQILDIAKRVTPAFRESPASCIALVREALKAAPAISESEDTKRLDFLAAESVDLVSFAIPYEDDADIGWRVLSHHMREPMPRVIGEVFRDDPRAAIDAARKGEKS